MAGANTFFGQQIRNQMSTPPPPRPAPSKTVTPTRNTGSGGLFSQPLSPQKKNFEQKLVEMVSRMQHHGGYVGLRGKPEELAARMTGEVDKIRKEKSHGFLPDNHQWRILCDMIEQERFTQAALAGYLTPSFLANADKTALQQRINTLNGLSQEEFLAHIRKAFRAPDPEVRRHK